jgi:hypothetical protein
MIERIDISDKKHNNLIIAFKILLNIELLFDLTNNLILRSISMLSILAIPLPVLLFLPRLNKPNQGLNHLLAHPRLYFPPNQKDLILPPTQPFQPHYPKAQLRQIVIEIVYETV